MEGRDLLISIAKMQEEMNKWHSVILQENLKKLLRNGFVDPIVYMLRYYKDTATYDTIYFDVEPDVMKTPEGADGAYSIIKSQTRDSKIIALMFVTEGCDTETGEKLLLLTFEERMRGRKDVYSFKKDNVVGENGKVSLKVYDIFHHRQRSLRNRSAAMEKFAHILRPYYFELTPALYN